MIGSHIGLLPRNVKKLSHFAYHIDVKTRSKHWLTNRNFIRLPGECCQKTWHQMFMTRQIWTTTSTQLESWRYFLCPLRLKLCLFIRFSIILTVVCNELFSEHPFCKFFMLRWTGSCPQSLVNDRAWRWKDIVDAILLQVSLKILNPEGSRWTLTQFDGRGPPWNGCIIVHSYIRYRLPDFPRFHQINLCLRLKSC